METKTVQEIDAITTALPVPVGAADAFTDALQTATPAGEYTGAVPVVDKSALVGVPMLIIGYAPNEGKGGTYVFVRCLLPNGSYVGFTDGGMAIPPVLMKHGEQAGTVDGGFDEERELVFRSSLYCPRGLRESTYTNKDGIDAATYWIG
ncbi:MAG: hypothetical protein ACYDHE_17150 [Candidatus Acidiferrales bacterium]